MIVILDNYDSFTYNLYQYVGEIDPGVSVVRNDRVTVDELQQMDFTHLIISPGPGYPEHAGISVDAVRALAGKKPILGVCLGHQAIGCAFGGKIVHAPHLFHGKSSAVHLGESRLFQGLPRVVNAGRYHSLVVEKRTLPAELVITAQTVSGEIMGLQHKKLPVYGLQFHPESVLTPEGKTILRNFLAI